MADVAGRAGVSVSTVSRTLRGLANVSPQVCALGAGARVYVCGDGSKMAPGVRDVFRTLYRDRTPGADTAAAEEWLNGLVAGGRYVEDVYAAG